MRLALTEPRFDAEPVERIRSQILTGIKASERDPGEIASRAMMEAIFGGHPYAEPSEGTVESVVGESPSTTSASGTTR